MSDKYFIVHDLGDNYLVEIRYTYRPSTANVASEERNLNISVDKEESLSDLVQMLLDFGLDDLTPDDRFEEDE